MKLELNVGQLQQQQQRQSLSPTLMKSLQLLSMPCYDLTGFLARAALDNPFLELDWSMVEEPAPLVTSSRSHSFDREDDFDPINFLPAEDVTHSLSEQLRLQLIDQRLPQRLFAAGEYIIGSLDQNGYFTDDESICAEFLGITPEEFRSVLTIVRGFQPTGIASRDLRQCLLAQADAERCDIHIVRRLLQLPAEKLERKNPAMLAQLCDASKAEIKKALHYLCTLNPRPGADSFGRQIEYVYPDIEVRREDREITFLFRSGCEILTLNERYAGELSAMEELEPKAREFIREKYRDAKALINELELRKNAIEKLMLYLIDYQHDFFSFANGRLKPLTMKQAAEAIGMHPSTVSRCVNGRYILTTNGMMPMKALFSAGLATETAKEIAPQEIRKQIAAEIRREDHRRPLSDQELTDILVRSGAQISRRTVAKYREQLGIPGSRDRRRK